MKKRSTKSLKSRKIEKTKEPTPTTIHGLLRDYPVKYVPFGRLKLRGEHVLGWFDPNAGIAIEIGNGNVKILLHEIGHMWANDHVRGRLYAAGFTKKQVFLMEEIFVNVLPLYVEILGRNDLL